MAIPRSEFPRWREVLAGFALYDAGAGRLRRLHPGDEPDPAHHQIWALDPVARQWRLDTFLENRTPDEWACHWLPSIRAPRADALAHTEDGIAYLRPEYALLAKAKHCRPKDEADLTQVLPTLDSAARGRLHDGLLVADPDHPWLSRLAAPGSR